MYVGGADHAIGQTLATPEAVPSAARHKPVTSFDLRDAMARLRSSANDAEQSSEGATSGSQVTRAQVMERAWQLRAGWGGDAGSEDGSWHSADE
jgi:hypothetical protein